MADNVRSAETSASPAAVWKIWSDASTWQEWNPDVQAMTMNGPFATGTTGVMKTKQGTRQVTLTEVVPGRSFRLETVVIPLTKFVFDCTVAAGPAGKTTVSQGVTVGGPLGGLVGGMMGKQIADTFPALLRGLARKAEASEGRS
ncbi:MAG TPA: SRPBCC family protein [Candidatus Dormibacteraeota bacterium]|nr:SRPBCC family protein [Candidatus Dormibacteraeota bacterium]